ncbi:MAG: hypothetical protein ACTHM1_01575 [Solirubrobacteraceae bacterium]
MTAVLLARRSKWQLLLLLALLGLGVGLVVVSQRHGVETHARALGHVLQALGEALLVAGLLAAVADPFVQQRFAEEWGIGLFWAIFNRDAPSVLRNAINEVAQPELYIAHAEWRVLLTWEDTNHTVLVVDVESHRRTVCVGRDGWHPIDVGSGLVTDFEGNPSRFKSLRVNAPSWSIYLDEESIQDHVRPDKSGAVRLDPRKALEHRRIHYREELITATRMETRLRAVDSLPLFQRMTALEWKIEVRGNAVPDLFVELFGSRYANAGIKSADSPPRWTFSSAPGGVTFPGNGLVLQWRPLAEQSPADGGAITGL